ncbi:MAG: class I SAM-dependent methyltransferase [Bacillota bacterium]|nr:class I SAM-dependent methyltransferase [Bacillota bacterium]
MNSERMEGILSLIPKSDIIIDVGTDHAYIPEAIIKRKIGKKVIGTEINQKPYLKAKDYIESKSLDDCIEIRKGDGLNIVKPDEIDVVVIAGMGGLLINRIIIENLSKISKGNTLVLQPMNAVDKTRKFLIENKFKILDEVLCKEDYHYYTVIKAVFIDKEYTCQDNLDFITNEILFKKSDKYIEEFTNKIIKKNSIIIENIKNHSSNKNRINELENINKKLKELLKKYEFDLYN